MRALLRQLLLGDESKRRAIACEQAYRAGIARGFQQGLAVGHDRSLATVLRAEVIRQQRRAARGGMQ